MTLFLDSGGVSMLARDRARLAELRSRGLWPAQVPSVVLTESLTGDHRRDHAVNRLLRACQIRPIDELTARAGARLRTATGRAGTITATDAVVAAMAAAGPDAVVLTSDPRDLTALVSHAGRWVRVMAVLGLLGA